MPRQNGKSNVTEQKKEAVEKPIYKTQKKHFRDLDSRTAAALAVIQHADVELHNHQIQLDNRMQEQSVAVATAAQAKAQLDGHLAICEALISRLEPGVQKAENARAQVKTFGNNIQEQITVLKAAIAAARVPATQAEIDVANLTNQVESLEAQLAAANEVAERERVVAAEADKACVREADELRSRMAALEAELAAARDAITQEHAAAAAAATAAAQAQVEYDAKLRAVQREVVFERNRLAEATKGTDQFISSMKQTAWQRDAQIADLKAKLKETKELAASNAVRLEAAAAGAMTLMAVKHAQELEAAVTAAVDKGQQTMDARVEEVVAAKSKEAEAMLDEVKRTSAEDLAKAHEEVARIKAAAAKAVADAQEAADRRVDDVIKSKDEAMAVMAAAAKLAIDNVAHAQEAEKASSDKLTAIHALEVEALAAEKNMLVMEQSRVHKKTEEDAVVLKSVFAMHTSNTAAAEEQTNGVKDVAVKVVQTSKVVQTPAQQPSTENRERELGHPATKNMLVLSSSKAAKTVAEQPAAKKMLVLSSSKDAKAVAQQPAVKKAASVTQDVTKVAKNNPWKKVEQPSSSTAFSVEEFPPLVQKQHPLAVAKKDTTDWIVCKPRRNNSLPKELTASQLDMSQETMGLHLKPFSSGRCQVSCKHSS